MVVAPCTLKTTLVGREGHQINIIILSRPSLGSYKFVHPEVTGMPLTKTLMG